MRWIIPCFFLVAPQAVFAHGTAIFVSTPFSPLLPYLWVTAGFVALVVAFVFILTRNETQRRKFIATYLATVFGSLVFVFFVGAFFSGMNSAPPPGFGFPAKVFYGYGWGDVGELFLLSNGMSLLFMATVMLVVMKRKGFSKAKRRTAVAGTVIIYLLALTPLIATGALSGGWHGGYVGGACRSNLGKLGRDLVAHANNNNQKLSAAKDCSELLEIMFDQPEEGAFVDVFTWKKDPAICPYENSYNPAPRPYQWNTELNGLTFKQLSELPGDTWLFKCHYKHNYTQKVAMIKVSDLLLQLS